MFWLPLLNHALGEEGVGFGGRVDEGVVGAGVAGYQVQGLANGRGHDAWAPHMV